MSSDALIHGIYLSSLAQSTLFTLNLKSDTFISACSHQAMQCLTLKQTLNLTFHAHTCFFFILLNLLNLFYILVIFKLLVITHVINAVILMVIFIFSNI